MANIQNELNNINNALYGRDVRSSIHDGIKKINDECENTTSEYNQLNSIFNQLIINAGNSNAEVVAARTDAAGNAYNSLKDRINAINVALEGKSTANGDFTINTSGTLTTWWQKINKPTLSDGWIYTTEFHNSYMYDGGITGSTYQNKATDPTLKLVPSDGSILSTRLDVKSAATTHRGLVGPDYWILYANTNDSSAYFSVGYTDPLNPGQTKLYANTTTTEIDSSVLKFKTVGYSQFDCGITASGGIISTGGNMVIGNKKGFRAYDTNGTEVTLTYLSSDNSSYFGWGGYNSQSAEAYNGGSYFVGGDFSVLKSKNRVYLCCNNSDKNATTGGSIVFMNNGTDYVFRPYAGGVTANGSKTYPWKSVYTNALNNNSDRSLKENIKYLGEDEKLTTKDMYDFIKDDCALATFNYKSDKDKTPKLNFIANDIIVNPDGSDNKVGQLIVNPKDDDILSYDVINYVSVINGALQEAINKIEVLENKIKELEG